MGQIYYNALFPCASAYLMTFNFSNAVYDCRLPVVISTRPIVR